MNIPFPIQAIHSFSLQISTFGKPQNTLIGPQILRPSARGGSKLLEADE